MLTVYVARAPKEPIILNDYWFNDPYNMKSIDFNDKNVQNLIKMIDGVDYIGKYKFRSKFTGTEVFVNQLSTGCKTAINIYSFPNEIFSVIECGGNALTEILKMKDGQILIENAAKPSKVNNEYNVIIDGRSEIFKDSITLWYRLAEYDRKRREEIDIE